MREERKRGEKLESEECKRLKAEDNEATLMKQRHDETKGITMMTTMDNEENGSKGEMKKKKKGKYSVPNKRN